MTTGKYPLRFFFSLALLVLAWKPVHAAEGATTWHNAARWQARLLWREEPDGQYQMAVHLRLDAGWKTYWQHAGESGLATEVIIAGGVHDAPVFPRPTVFAAGGDLWSIGYKDELVLPWRVTTADVMDVVMDFGVCDTLCLPARYETRFDPRQAPANRKVSRYLDSALSQAPRHQGDFQGAVTQDGRTVRVANPGNAAAVLVTGGAALVARQHAADAVFSLPSGHQDTTQQAVLWLLGKDQYLSYDVTLP